MSGWTTLDYPRAQIIMRAVSKWEQSFRAFAVKKEPWTVAWIETIPQGAVFWDVGANTAPYALIAGSRGIRTFAFEPGYANYAAACDNVLANPAVAPNVIMLPLALSDVTALVPFGYRNLEPGAASHSFGATGGQLVAQLPAVAVRADELCNAFKLPPPTHLKIDVDGAEVQVLAGLGGLMAAVQSVLIELPNQAPSTPIIQQMLHAGGLTLITTHNLRDGKPIPDVHYEEWRRLP